MYGVFRWYPVLLCDIATKQQQYSEPIQFTFKIFFFNNTDWKLNRAKLPRDMKVFAGSNFCDFFHNPQKKSYRKK